MTNKILRLLGLARQAGKLQYGTDCVQADVKVLPLANIAVHTASDTERYQRNDHAIFIADDSGNSVVRNANHLAEKHSLKLIKLPFSKSEVGNALGKKDVAIISIADRGFISAIEKEINSLI